MVAASVHGAPDTHDMRGVVAPGVWAHAMALDNLLTLGNGYRRAVVGSYGFAQAGPLSWLWTASHVLLAGILILPLLRMAVKSRINNFVEGKIPNDFRKGLICVFLEGTIGGLFLTVLAFTIAMILLCTTILPPLNWIGVSALALATWALVDTP